MPRTLFAADDLHWERRMRSVRNALQVIDQLRGAGITTILTNKPCITKWANPSYL